MPHADHSGEVNVLICQSIIMDGEIASTFCEVVIGWTQGERPDQITIFDPTGLAIQDPAIIAIATRNGRSIDLPFP